MSGRVLTTPEAEAASTRMNTIINGPLDSDLTDLISQGDTLAEPTVWEGRHASTFRSGWPNTKTQLREAQAQLNELRAAIERVRADIVAAGGGG